MKPSPRKSGERVTRSRGAALVELKSPQKTSRRTRSIKAKPEEKEMPEPQEDPVESVATPSTRSSKRKPVSGNATDVPKSVERRSSRRTRSLVVAAPVEDPIAEDAEMEPVVVMEPIVIEEKTSNDSEMEENLESRKTKMKTSDSTDDQPVQRITRRTRSVASAIVETPELESIDESLAEKAITKGSKKSKVSEVETEAVEEEQNEMTENTGKNETKRKTRKSLKSEGTEEMESASGIEDGDADGKTQEMSSIDVASESNMEDKNSVENCVVAEKKIKSPKSKKSPKITENEENFEGAENEENKKESKKSKKKSLDGTETIQETQTDINMNTKESVLDGTEKSVEKSENQEGGNQAPVVREVREEEIVNFISSCRQETEKTLSSEGAISEKMPEKAETPKKSPKKQKDMLSPIEESSVEELADNQESESKKSDEIVAEEAKPSKTPKKSPKKQKDMLSPIEEGSVEESADNQDLKSNEIVPENAESSKTPKKTPKKQKGKPSLVEASVDESADNQELESKKSDEAVAEDVEPSKTPKKSPKKQKSKPVEDVAVAPADEQVVENNLADVEMTESSKVGEMADDESGNVVLRLDDDVEISEMSKKKKKSKTPKKNKKDIEQLPNSESTFEVSVFDTPASSPEVAVSPKTSSEEVPKLETSKGELLDTSGSVESKGEEEMKDTKTPKSAKKSKKPKKKKDNLSSNDEGPIEELVDHQEPESKKSDKTTPEEEEPSKPPKKTPKKQKAKTSAEDELVDNQESESKELDKTVPEEPEGTPQKQDKLSANDEGSVEDLVDNQEQESKIPDESVPAEVEPSKVPKKTPKKRKAKAVEDECSAESVDQQEPESKIPDETVSEEAEPSKVPKKTPKKRKAKSVEEESVDQQVPESKIPDETVSEEAEPSKTPKKTKKRKHKPSVEVDAEASTQLKEDDPAEIVNDAPSEHGEGTIDQVKDSPVFTKVKSPSEASIAEVVHKTSPLHKDVKKADIQNDADSDISFQPISKTLLEEKKDSNKTSDVPPGEVGVKAPLTDVENPIVIEDENTIVIDDSGDDELQSLELMKLIKKLKKKKKILKALEVEEKTSGNEKPKKKGKKKKIVETIEVSDVVNEDETVENEEPVKEEVEEEENLTTEKVDKKKKKRSKKKKKLEETVEIPDATEDKDETVENEEPEKEAVKPSELAKETVSKKKKRKRAAEPETAEVSKKASKKSEDVKGTKAVDETEAKTEKSKKREHENTEDDSSSEKKLKLETVKTKKPGTIYSSTLPTAVDSIELQNLFLEKDIKLLYMRKKNWKTEICIENADQIGDAASLLSEHYMGNSVRIDKYFDQPKTEGVVDDDGLRYCQLYVNRIAPHVTESDLRALFPKAIRCDLPKRNNGLNKGFCYLTFPNKATSQEHLILDGKVNLAGYKLGIHARNQDRNKGIYGNLLKEMLIHVTDLDSVLIIENIPSDLHQFNLSTLFPSVLKIHVNPKAALCKESGAVIICKTADQAQEFLSQEILWNDEPLTVKKATRDLLYLARKPVNESHKRPAAYTNSTLLVTNLPDKVRAKDLEQLFPSCVLINVVANKKYALVGFSTRAEMLEISQTESDKLTIKGRPISVKPYADDSHSNLVKCENDFSKLLHVRGFPRFTKRPEMKTVFKNCKISMTQTGGVPYAVVKCKTAKKAKEYLTKPNLVVGGQVLKIRYLQSILKQMKKEAELK